MKTTKEWRQAVREVSQWWRLWSAGFRRSPDLFIVGCSVGFHRWKSGQVAFGIKLSLGWWWCNVGVDLPLVRRGTV